VIITEADRATARRVIRRHVGARPTDEIVTGSALHLEHRPQLNGSWTRAGDRTQFVSCGREFFDACGRAAAQGRAYAKALREAR